MQFVFHAHWPDEIKSFSFPAPSLLDVLDAFLLHVFYSAFTGDKTQGLIIFYNKNGRLLPRDFGAFILQYHKKQPAALPPSLSAPRAALHLVLP